LSKASKTVRHGHNAESLQAAGLSVFAAVPRIGSRGLSTKASCYSKLSDCFNVDIQEKKILSAISLVFDIIGLRSAAYGSPVLPGMQLHNFFFLSLHLGRPRLLAAEAADVADAHQRNAGKRCYV
jgi:hypothetical protein